MKIYEILEDAYMAGREAALHKAAASNLDRMYEESVKRVKEQGPESRLSQSAKKGLAGALIGGGIGTVAGAPFLLHPKTRNFGLAAAPATAGLLGSYQAIKGAVKDPEQAHVERLSRMKRTRDFLVGEGATKTGATRFGKEMAKLVGGKNATPKSLSVRSTGAVKGRHAYRAHTKDMRIGSRPLQKDPLTVASATRSERAAVSKKEKQEKRLEAMMRPFQEKNEYW